MGRAAVSNVVAGGEAQLDAPPCRVQFCPDEPLSLEEAVPMESETGFNFAVVTPSPQYNHPQRSWMPVACSTKSMPEAPQAAAGQSSSADTCNSLSLFRTLGLIEMGEIEAIAEASESEDDSESERTPMCAEPLSLDEDESEESESEAPLGFPLMTPSPAYDAAASARYASLRSGRQFPLPQVPAGFSAGARFESFPCALKQPGLSFGLQPRLAAVGGA